MSKTLESGLHRHLSDFLAAERRRAGLTQAELAERLGRNRVQSYVANIEAGQRRVDVVELIWLAQVLGFDPKSAVGHLEDMMRLEGE